MHHIAVLICQGTAPCKVSTIIAVFPEQMQCALGTAKQISSWECLVTVAVQKAAPLTRSDNCLQRCRSLLLWLMHFPCYQVQSNKPAHLACYSDIGSCDGSAYKRNPGLFPFN